MGDDNKTRGDLTKLIDALRTIADGLGEGATVERVLALLTISYHTQVNKGIDQNELARVSETSPSTMSRNVAALSDIGDRGRTPLNMIEVRFDPTDRRRRIVSTNHKGDALVNKALARLTGRK